MSQEDLLQEAASPEAPAQRLWELLGGSPKPFSFSVTLEEAGEFDEDILYSLQSILNITYEKAQDLIESVPSLLGEDLTIEEASSLYYRFLSLGARVVVGGVELPEDLPLLYALAQNPGAPKDLLRYLSLSSNPEVQRAVIQNPNTTTETLWALGYLYPNELLENPFLPLLLLEDPTLSQAPQDLLLLLAREANEIPSWLSGVLLLTPEGRDELIERANILPAKVLGSLLLDTEYHRTIAMRAVEPSTLLTLAKSPFNDIRELVAENKAASEEVLLLLAKDSRAVIRGKVAQNPGASSRILCQLLLDKQDDIRGLARANPNAPIEVVQLLERAGASFHWGELDGTPKEDLLSSTSLISGSIQGAEGVTPAEAGIHSESSGLTSSEWVPGSSLGTTPIGEAGETQDAKGVTPAKAGVHSESYGLASSEWVPGSSLGTTQDEKNFVAQGSSSLGVGLSWRDREALLALGGCAYYYLTRDPSTPQELIHKIATSEDSAARSYAAKHPHLSRELMSLLQRAGAYPDLQWFDKMEQDFSLSEKELAQLVHSGSFAKLLVASHPNASAALLSFCWSPAYTISAYAIEEELCRALLFNPRTPEETITLIAVSIVELPSGEQKERLEDLLSRHPSVSREAFSQFASGLTSPALEAPLYFYEAWMLEGGKFSEKLQKLLRQARSEVVRSLAQDPKTPSVMIAWFLLAEEDAGIRSLLCKHPNAPEEVKELESFYRCLAWYEASQSSQ